MEAYSLKKEKEKKKRNLRLNTVSEAHYKKNKQTSVYSMCISILGEFRLWGHWVGWLDGYW